MAGQVLAYDYPLLGAFWTVLWIFLWVMWFMLLFRIIVDVFRDDGISGWAKTGWLVLVLIVPFLGVLVYVIARGRGMGSREIKHAQEQKAMVDDYIRETAAKTAPPSHVDELDRLARLKASGDLTTEEFERAKEKILH
ncbi:SHOCT domain-containing protein [Streptomyces bambusae]|uniref:SHOCT domain-containing protein n=1 Tax=Streptomyces bambusae TaxID=1550616 RepID=UPI001CFC8BBC|nr:SHOCT domain-containing protein [Streptomyces bambusae]MCB5167526.1 SHOCT domain-containing protein [Streptomyces bambusae]